MDALYVMNIKVEVKNLKKLWNSKASMIIGNYKS
jgi:hypothetical protein